MLYAVSCKPSENSLKYLRIPSTQSSDLVVEFLDLPLQMSGPNEYCQSSTILLPLTLVNQSPKPSEKLPTCFNIADRPLNNRPLDVVYTPHVRVSDSGYIPTQTAEDNSKGKYPQKM